MIWTVCSDWRAPAALAHRSRSPRRTRLATAFVTKTIQLHCIRNGIVFVHVGTYIYWAIRVARVSTSRLWSFQFQYHISAHVDMNVESTRQTLLWLTFKYATNKRKFSVLPTIPIRFQTWTEVSPIHCRPIVTVLGLHKKHYFTLQMLYGKAKSLKFQCSIRFGKS